MCIVCLLFSVLCPLSFVYAGVLKVSLLLGDSYSKTTAEAVQAVRKELETRKGLRKDSDGRLEVLIQTYPEKDIRKNDLSHLRESHLVIVFTMGRQLVGAVKPELDEVIRKGGRVYAVGASFDSDQKKMGLVHDEAIDAYFRTGLAENLKNMVFYTLKKDFGWALSVDKPVRLPEWGIYETHSKKVFEDFAAYQAACHGDEAGKGRIGRPWIGLLFHRMNIETGQTRVVDAIIESLEGKDFNVLPVFGHPTETVLERFFLSPSGPRISLIVALGAKVAINPTSLGPLFDRIGVPVIDAITLYSQSEKEWRQSPVGLNIFERSWLVGNPEMAGIIAPTVIGSREKAIDRETRAEVVEEWPIPGRIKRLADRVKAWVTLQEKANRDKRVALIYYNYPPGKQNIGAAYLNVLPDSLWEILKRLRTEGYDFHEQGSATGLGEINRERLFGEVREYGRNIGNWAPAEIDRLARSGRAVLLPVARYQEWFAALPEGLRQSVLKSWGPVEKSTIMIWRDGLGKKYLVIPALQYGNILLTPQPSRGWEQDPVKMVHDLSAPPHHQYLAFYLWLKQGFKADALAHIGTHGTHEWLSGKEVGFTDEDPPEALIQDLPNIYPYVVDDVGEGLQAKRRGLAVIIDHMTPPFNQAGMNRELREIMNLISDYESAKHKSQTLADSKSNEILSKAKKTGLIVDLGLKVKDGGLKDDDIQAIEQHIKDIAQLQTPFGLHTFGKAPEEKYRRSTAEAILSLEKGLSDEERKRRREDLEERILRSAQRELDSLAAALSGRYIPAGQGNDPIRNPDSLPTGKNFYSFDATRIPSRAIYEMGARLATTLVDSYQAKHGVSPDKLAFTLWAVETITNEGVMESQIMHLLGIRPKWDERGRVTGVETISRAELGRPRIDVTIVPSGLYRDLFPNLMDLLDRAVQSAKEQDEEDNTIRANIKKTSRRLIVKGIDPEKAERLAAVRIFGEPSGAYGNGLGTVITKSDSWKQDKQVVQVYFNRTGHLFGQGFWGDNVMVQESEGQGQEDIGISLFKSALAGTKIAVHGRSSNLIGTLDNDDVYQYLGGLAMAIRSVDGKSPEIYLTNLANPKDPRQETIEKYMGREMRSRTLNPEWIKAMMKEGYAGAKFVSQVTENLWGWQVTLPEAVDGAKWNELYETYVLDRNGLNLKELFRQAGNLVAYQALVARMLETTRKGYWKPDNRVIETLAKEYAKSAIEAGLACCDHTCNNPELTALTTRTLGSVPGLRSLARGLVKAQEVVKGTDPIGSTDVPKVSGGKSFSTKAVPKRTSQGSSRTPGGKEKPVTGYEVEETGPGGGSSAPIPYLFLIGFVLFIGLIALGFRRRWDR